MDIWDRYAKAYDRLSSLTSYYNELSNKVLAALKDCDNVLDNGTGTGILAKRLAEHGKTIVGIDSSEAMLSIARSKVSLNKLLTFDLGSSEHLPYKDKTFDGVACINVLFYLDNPMQALKESYRVLKAGGIFVVSGPKPNPDGSLLEQRALSDYRKQPDFEELAGDIQVVSECARTLLSSCLKNTYSTKGMAEILLAKIGFNSIVDSGEVYLNQGFFVVARK